MKSPELGHGMSEGRVRHQEWSQGRKGPAKNSGLKQRKQHQKSQNGKNGRHTLEPAWRTGWPVSHTGDWSWHMSVPRIRVP